MAERIVPDDYWMISLVFKIRADGGMRPAAGVEIITTREMGKEVAKRFQKKAVRVAQYAEGLLRGEMQKKKEGGIDDKR